MMWNRSMMIVTLIMIRTMIDMTVVIKYKDDVVGKLHCWTNVLVFPFANWNECSSGWTGCLREERKENKTRHSVCAVSNYCRVKKRNSPGAVTHESSRLLSRDVDFAIGCHQRSAYTHLYVYCTLFFFFIITNITLKRLHNS